MNLETWLRLNNMKASDFMKLIGCSRSVIWKVKKGLDVNPKIALKIQIETNFHVNPSSHPVGIRRS